VGREGLPAGDVDPADTARLKSEDKPESKEVLLQGVQLLAELQDMLYAPDLRALLLIFQAMDAAGKDGAILSSFGLQHSEVGKERLAELARVRETLLSET
jgi:Polyphosphate kinase 2 (PPK2)